MSNQHDDPWPPAEHARRLNSDRADRQQRVARLTHRIQRSLAELAALDVYAETLFPGRTRLP